MASLDTDAVLAFVDTFQTTQLAVWGAALAPDLKWNQQVRRKKGLEAAPKTSVEFRNRPHAADDAWYASVAGSWSSAGGRDVKPTSAGSARLLAEGSDDKSRTILSALS